MAENLGAANSGRVNDRLGGLDEEEKETASILRKHGGKTGEELKAEGK